MSHKEALYGWFILLTLLFVAVLFVSDPLSSPTGAAVSTASISADILSVNPDVSAEKAWDFLNSSEYTYNSSAISVNGTAQLVLITTNTSSTINDINETLLLSAVKYEDDDAEDKTDKVNTIGQGNVQLNDQEIVLEVKLTRLMQDNDILSLYLLSGTDASGKIYLCKNSSGCSSGEYGNRTLPGSVVEDWYNITLSGMSASSDTFFIDSPDKIKIDMIQGYVKSSRTETTSTSSYPSSASIQTGDFQPMNWKRWGVLSKTQQLNGQTVNYYYSTDSGSIWITVPANGNLSAVAASTLRFRAELNSNITSTPAVDTITLAYTTQAPCTESWSAQYTSCLKNDTKLKYYSDANECGTISALPTDNNTYVSCDYCALFNCSASVIQKPVAEMRENKTTYVVDAKNTTNTRLEIEAETFLVSVEIIEYVHNIKNETPSSTAVNRYVNLESNAANISSVKIILYYNDSDIAALDENTLKIYYYNETSKAWDALPSTVNASGNYVYAVVPHLSLYGLFGEQPSSDSGSSSGVSSGGGGGSRKKTDLAAPASDAAVVETAETILPTRSEPESAVELTAPVSETSCEYVVEMTLPDEIVLGEQDSYEGEITNKGNCGIPELRLGLSPELESKIGLPLIEFSDIRPGDREKFILIRKKAENKDLFSATSYVIGSLKADKNTFGQVILQGYDERGEIFRRELPVSIVLKNSFPGKELATGGMILAVLMIFAVRLWSTRSGKRRKRKTIQRKE